MAGDGDHAAVFLHDRLGDVEPQSGALAWLLGGEKGAKILSRTSGLIPGPVSAIVAITMPSSRRVDNRRVPRPFIAWTALMTS
jgi:hypothetical protein